MRTYEYLDGIVDGIFEYFTALNDNINKSLDDLATALQIGKIYVIVSTIILLIVVILAVWVLLKLNKVSKKIDKLSKLTEDVKCTKD